MPLRPDLTRLGQLVGGSIDFAHSTGRNMRYKTAAGATLATGPVGTNSSTNTVSISVPIYTGGKLEGQIEEAKATKNIMNMA